MGSRGVVTGLRAFREAPRRAVVTVGVFDGVHAAHRQLIRTTVQLARRLHGTSVVVTFDPDPQAVLNPARTQPALMPLRVRVASLRALGAQRVWVIPFTRRFARMSAEQFIRRLLVGRLRAEALVVGEAFAFGRNRRGDLAALRALGPRLGMRVVCVRAITRGGAPVSSSRIRRLIAGGQLAPARALLGYAPMLYGVVEGGAGRGRRLGFPTANIRLASQLLPPQGVYAVAVREAASRRLWRGVMNLGVRPTFGRGPLVCEVHLLGFAGRLLGRPVAISLLKRLRAERRFPTPAVLQRQVARDVRRARHLFHR